MTSPIATSLWTLTLTGTVHTFQVKSVTATLDELNTVYGQATVTVAPYPKAIDDAILAAILAGTKRATLVATRTLIAPTVGTQTRTFDLIVHERVLRADGSVSFELATDEALLEVRGRVATTELDHWIHVSLAGITARAAINRILSLFAGGASLLAGAVDAAVHRLKPSRNLIANGSFEVDIVGWVAFGNASSLTRSTTFALDGVASLRWSATAAGSSAVNTTPIPVTQGRWYKGQVAIRSQVARDAQLYLQTLDSAGTVITSTAALVPSSTSAWSVINHRVYVDDPRVATIRLVVQTNANATGNQHYLDSVILEEIDPATMGTRPSFSKFGADLGGVAERLFYNPTLYWNGSTADTVYYQ